MILFRSVCKRILLTGFLFTLAACGGGGGGTGGNIGTPSLDSITVSVGTATIGPLTTTYSGPTLSAIGFVYTSPSQTYTTIQADTPAVNLVVSADGAAAGTYPITGNLAKLSVRYTVYGATTSTFTMFSTNASGTIVLTNVGSVGTQITGTFNAVAFEVMPVSDPTHTIGLSGSFSVKRWF